MRFEGKRNTVLFFIFLFVPSVALFGLTGSRNLSDYVTTSFYISVSLASLVILAMTKSDDKYYKNLSLPNLLGAVILALIMTAFSWGLSSQLKNPDMLLSVGTMSLTAMSTSVSTTFLSMLVYGLVFVATSEELLKLPMFAEGKERWGKGYKIGKITIPGILVYVGFPVGFWAALHGIIAYQDPVMIIPAAFNGILLIVYLWKTECILGCIFGHWLYNGFITTITFINGRADVPPEMPFFPNILSSSYYSNSGFIYDLVLFMIIAIAILLFLLPSLRSDKSNIR
jgi:hypothetical protein